MRSFLIEELNARLRYHDIPGELPARIYLHGLGAASSFVFPEIAAHPRLAGHRALLIDLLGFGFSDRPAGFGYSLADHAQSVARVLDHLGLSYSHVIGHSMGGSIAILLASERPNIVSRLVVAEGNLNPGGGFLSRSIAAQGEQEYIETGHAALLDRLRSSHDHIDREFAVVLQMAAPIAVHRSAVSLVQLTHPTIGERFFRLPIRRTFLIGERSTPYKDEPRLRSAGIRVCIIPAAGHVMMVDNPSGFAEAVAESLTDEAG